jgi:hypothetical protein
MFKQDKGQRQAVNSNSFPALFKELGVLKEVHI